MLALVAIATTARAQFERVWLIDETNFPDQNFREYVLNNIDTDGGRSLTLAERNAVTSIDLSSMAAVLKRVSNLTGIELFKNLTYLDCSGHLLESLDLSQNTALTYLDCSDNSWKTTGNFGLTIWESLSSLNVSQNTALTYLDCSGNSLTTLSVTNNTALTTLKCRNNSLTSLSVSNNRSLQTLDCGNNQLTALSLTNNTRLGALDCSSNSLTSLSVSNCRNLTTLNCNNNQLTSLSLTNNARLETLDCGKNQLTRLSLSEINFSLTTLYCYRNKIKDANMTTLVNSLPTVSGGNFHVIDTYYSDEENVITALQVKVAKEKGWTVYDYHPTTPTEYAGIVVIDETNFPDANFRSFVALSSIDTDQDSILTPAEIAAVTTMDVSTRSIYRLKGIEFFTALTELNCRSNKLTALDVSQNTALTRLDCDDNNIEGDALWALVESLPNVESGTFVVIYYYTRKEYTVTGHGRYYGDQTATLTNQYSLWYGNDITQRQVALAQSKGWQVKRYNETYTYYTHATNFYYSDYYYNRNDIEKTYANHYGKADPTIVISENGDSRPTAARSVDVNVKRTINANEWGTIWLPFAMTAEQMQATFGSDVKLCNFTGYTPSADANGDIVGITVNFENASEIEANRPYIIKVSSPVTQFTVENVDIAPEAEPTINYGTTRKPKAFIGTYAAETLVPDQCLFLSGGKFYYSKGLTKMKGYRAYFDFYDVLTSVENASAGVKIGFNIDGETTGIDNSQLSIVNSNDGWYTLDGIKLNGEPKKKGIYIHNGKKVKK